MFTKFRLIIHLSTVNNMFFSIQRQVWTLEFVSVRRSDEKTERQNKRFNVWKSHRNWTYERGGSWGEKWME